MAMSAWPLYVSPLPLPGYESFESAKLAKVQEIMETSDALYQASIKLMYDLTRHQEKYLDFLDVLAQAPGFNKNAKQLASQRIALATKERAIQLSYESISFNGSGNAYAQAQMKYQKTLLATELASSVWYDFRHTVTQSIALGNALSWAPKNVINAYKQYEKLCKNLDALNPDLQKLQTTMSILNNEFKQLATADYLVAKASIAYLNQQMPAVQEKGKSLKTSKQLTQENIQFINEYTAQIASFSSLIQKQIDSVDTSKLLSWSSQPSPTLLSLFIPTVQAKSDESLAAASDVLESKWTSTFGNAATFTRETIKSWFGKAQTAVGVGLDSVSAITKTPMDLAMASYYTVGSNQTWTDLVTDTASTVKGNFTQIKGNYDQGKSWSEIWKNAGQGMERLENTAGDAAWGAVEYVAGKGRTSRAVGGITKMTVSMFTGLGKWIYKIADKQSTAGQITEGMLDVGLSFIGGSKVIVKGSQALGASKELTKRSASKGYNYLVQMSKNLEANQLKSVTAEILKNAKLTPSQVAKLISTSLEMEGKQAVVAQLEVMSKELTQKFADMIKQGFKGIYGNMTEGANQSFKEFVKLNMEHSLQGYKEALLKTLGEWYADYIDNLIASKIDDLVKAAIKTYIDASVFDGVYELKMPLGKDAVLPIKVIIENWALSGWVEYSLVQWAWHGKISLAVKGMANENGKLEATWEWRVDAGGPSSEFDLFGANKDKKTCTDTLGAKGSWPVAGTVTSGGVNVSTLSVTLQGTITVDPGSSFWCTVIEWAGTPKPIEGMKAMELKRIE